MLKSFSSSIPKLPFKKLHIQITVRPLTTTTTTTMAPLKSWLSIPQDSHFSLSNIPFGIITSKNNPSEKRPAIAIGDHVLDLKAFSKSNGFSGLPSLKDPLTIFSQPTLNAFAALGQPVHNSVRTYIQDVFSESTSNPSILKDNASLQKEALLPKHETKTHLPMQIGDYTDFYAGKNHAFNVGYVLLSLPFPTSHLPPPHKHS